VPDHGRVATALPTGLCVTLLGPVLLTGLYCVVAHVVSPRSTHACRTQSPLVARLAGNTLLLEKKYLFGAYDLPTPSRRLLPPATRVNELVSGLAGPQSPLWTCAANFCLDVTPRHCHAFPKPYSKKTEHARTVAMKLWECTPLSPGLRQGTWGEGD
jgi:hypothetical protein